MLSKCLNSRCSATFQYLGRGQLFRVDFADVGRNRARNGKEVVASIRSKACPVEHFWLCEQCAATLTVGLSEGGEVCLVPHDASKRKRVEVVAPQGRTAREAAAS